MCRFLRIVRIFIHRNVHTEGEERYSVMDFGSTPEVVEMV